MPPDRLDDRDLDFYRRVRAAYLELARCEPDRFVMIDASGERERTAAQVLAALADLGAPGGSRAANLGVER
jgi:dTMP kinase